MNDQLEMQEVSRFERLLTLQVPESDLDAAKTRAARKISRELKIKGFRPGKAPRRIVEATVGEARVRSEALEEVLPELVGSALENAEVEPAVAPSVENMRDVDDGLEVEVKITLWPTLDAIPTYDGRHVAIEAPQVDDDAVQEQLDRLRDQFAELETVSRSSHEGDFVSINLNASKDGSPVEEASATDLLYEVGSRSFIEGLDETVSGVSAGDIATFQAVLPEGFGELAGTDVAMSVLVKEVKEKKLPELTDEWVSDFTEFETVEELREELVSRMGEMLLGSARNDFQSKVVTELVDDMDLAVPEAIVSAEMEEIFHRFSHQLGESGIEFADYLQISGMTQEAFIEDLRSQASRSVSTDILLDAVAGAESLEVTGDELTAMYAILAQQAGEDPAEIAARLEGSVQEKRIVGDILRRKALEQVMLSAVPVDENGSPIDLALEAPEEDAAADIAEVTEASADTAEVTEASADTAEVTEASADGGDEEE